MPVNYQSWGDAMMGSVSQGLAVFMAAIPKLIGFAIILVIGWFLASLIGRGIAALLRTVRFNELAQRSGFADFVTSMGVQTDSSGFIALLSKGFIRLLALVVAFDALGLPAVSDVMRQALLWLPNLVVGLVILVLGGLAANAVAGVVRGATDRAGLGEPATMAAIAKATVWAFAIVVAVNQIGIAQTLINTLFVALVGGAALAFGLAFGLGGREAAAELISDWRQKTRDAAPKIKRAANDAARQAQSAATRPIDGMRKPN
jgi:Conserved TM helix